MRTGVMWGWQGYGLTPDIFVCGKGLGGGIYPISACLVTEECGGWLVEDGAAHISTSGGAELGCLVGHHVLEMLQRPEVISNVHFVAEFFARGMAEMMRRHSDIFVGVRQRGVVLGLEFDHPEGAVAVSRALYENGVWRSSPRSTSACCSSNRASFWTSISARRSSTASTPRCRVRGSF